MPDTDTQPVSNSLMIFRIGDHRNNLRNCQTMMKGSDTQKTQAAVAMMVSVNV